MFKLQSIVDLPDPRPVLTVFMMPKFSMPDSTDWRKLDSNSITLKANSFLKKSRYALIHCILISTTNK